MEQLIEMMRQAFANNFTYYLESHNAHWNTVGPDFPQYHAFLKEIYEDAQTSIDDYAEKTRQLHAFAHGTYIDIIRESKLVDPTDIPVDPTVIFKQILGDNDILVQHLQDTYDQAGKVREYGIQNFLADRIDAHKQQAWMLRSILNVKP